MEWAVAIVTAIWVMLPAYVPNNVAVLAGGGAPIDGGRTWRGRRILGDGKTWRGTIAGVAAGLGLALSLDAVRPEFLGVVLPGFPIRAALCLAAGAMVGDIAASFLKRRIGRSRGAAVPVVDQLDFVAGALLLTATGAPAWFQTTFTARVLAVVVFLTPLLHVATNGIAHLAGLKDEPW